MDERGRNFMCVHITKPPCLIYCRLDCFIAVLLLQILVKQNTGPINLIFPQCDFLEVFRRFLAFLNLFGTSLRMFVKFVCFLWVFDRPKEVKKITTPILIGICITILLILLPDNYIRAEPTHWNRSLSIRCFQAVLDDDTMGIIQWPVVFYPGAQFCPRVEKGSLEKVLFLFFQ